MYNALPQQEFLTTEPEYSLFFLTQPELKICCPFSTYNVFALCWRIMFYHYASFGIAQILVDRMNPDDDLQVVATRSFGFRG